MAFTRSQLRQIIGDALTDEQIKQVMDAVHEEVDSLKDKLDEAKSNKDAETWKTKCEKIRKEWLSAADDRVTELEVAMLRSTV